MKTDRSAIMRRAHKDYRYWRRVGDPRSFSECLKSAWRVAHALSPNRRRPMPNILIGAGLPIAIALLQLAYALHGSW